MEELELVPQTDSTNAAEQEAATIFLPKTTDEEEVVGSDEEDAARTDPKGLPGWEKVEKLAKQARPS